jgi:hypothetical protein
MNYEKSNSKNQLEEEEVHNNELDIRDFDQLQNQNNSENEIQNNHSLRETNSVKENEKLDFLENEEFND